MHIFGRNLLLAITLLSFTACTTLQPLEDFSPSRIRQQVEVGDRVQIVAMTGATYDLKVTKIGVDALHGKARSGKQYKVMFEAIRSIQIEKVSGWKVATAVGATMTTLVVIVSALVIYALFTLGE